MSSVTPLPPDPATQALLRLLPRGEVIAKYRQERYEREIARLQQFADDVRQETDWDELFERLAVDERLDEMFRRAVERARSTSDRRHVRLLARAVSNGARADDDTEIDLAEQLLVAATDISVVDLRALIIVAERGYGDPHHGLGQSGFDPAAAELAVGRLNGLGLLKAHPARQAGLDDSWSVSAAGRALLGLLGDERTPEM